MKKRLILFGGLLILLLTACGNKPPVETLAETVLPYEQETGTQVATTAVTETEAQEEGNLYWEELPQETLPAETSPKQTVKPSKPGTPAATTPKQEADTTKPEPTKPTEESVPTETTEPSVEPTETTEPMETPTETTKPTEGSVSGSGNGSPEWTPPVL